MSAQEIAFENDLCAHLAASSWLYGILLDHARLYEGLRSRLPR